MEQHFLITLCIQAAGGVFKNTRSDLTKDAYC